MGRAPASNWVFRSGAQERGSGYGHRSKNQHPVDAAKALEKDGPVRSRGQGLGWNPGENQHFRLKEAEATGQAQGVGVNQEVRQHISHGKSVSKGWSGKK